MEHGRRADPRLVRGPADRRAHRRRAAPSRPDPADRLRGGADRPGARRPHRAAVRPPRQAAGDDRVARRPRAVDARDRGRPALRPRRRRRRLRRLRRAHRHRGRPSRGRRPRPPARAHRGQRGERQPRPAGARRGAGRPHRLARARHLPRLRLPRRRAAVGHDVAARDGQRSTSPSRSSTPAPTAARPAASSRRASGSSASCSTASRTARPGACCSPSCTSRSPTIACARSPRPSRRSRSGRRDEFPFAGSTRPMTDDPVEQFLAVSWRPTLSYIAADGFPPFDRAGNVLRPSTTLTLSFRLPPTCDHAAALAAIERMLDGRSAERGDRARRRASSAPGLERTAVRSVAHGRRSTRRRRRRSASRRGRSARAARSRSWACSASASPTPSSSSPARSCPGSNAHGPDEFLHLPTARRVTECIARLLGAHAASPAP